MKKITVLLAAAISVCLSLSASAQTSSTFLVPNPKTAKWSYIETDAKGQVVATQYHSVDALDGDGINGSLKLLVEEITKSPADTLKNFIFYRFKDGEYTADMNAMFEGDILETFVDSAIKEEGEEISQEQMKAAMETIRAELKISGEVRGIPRYPKVGNLPDFEFQIKFSILNMKVNGENRRILGTEKITTNAGTFDCFILEEILTTKAMMMKEVEKVKSWYAYGIGLVKEITYDKNGKLISTIVLNSINW